MVKLKKIKLENGKWKAIYWGLWTAYILGIVNNVDVVIFPGLFGILFMILFTEKIE